MKRLTMAVILATIGLLLGSAPGARADVTTTAPPDQPTASTQTAPTEPPAAPILQIETGMDTSGIRRIALDAGHHILATASVDKTVRLWDANTGAALEVLRPPIGLDNDGKLYCVAISPDGQTVATGGWTGTDWDNTFSIYIFDRQTGDMVKRITGLPDVIDNMVWSPDGKYVEASIGDANGVRLYSTADWSLVGEDDGYKAESYGADWWMGPDGRLKLAVASYDGVIRLYNIDPSKRNLLGAPLKAACRGGKQPYGIAFSPDGNKIAVGFSDLSGVTVISGNDLSYLFTRQVVGSGSGDISHPVWSADGQVLYGAGSYGTPQTSSIFRWTDGGKGPQTELAAYQNTITALLPRGNDGVYFGTGFPAVGAMDKDGNTVYINSASVADFPISDHYFMVNYDGSKVQFAYDQDQKFKGYLSIADRTIGLDTGDNHPGMNPPIVSDPKIDVENWRNVAHPPDDPTTVNGKPLVDSQGQPALEDYETVRSLAIAPDRSCFVLGTEWYIRCFAPDGKQIWAVNEPDLTWAVNISGDGKLVVATLGDGTLRWLTLKDGTPLLACFPLGDKKRWVMWTPSGYYDCSPGGEDLLGWHVNRGKDQAADFFPASRFRDQFYRPDVIANILGDMDEDEAVQMADKASGRVYEKPDVLDQLPPVVKILTPDSGTPNPGGMVTIKYLVRAGSTEKAEAVHFQVDGRNVGRAIRVQLVATNEQEQMQTVEVPSSACTVSVIAENRFGSSQAASVTLRWKGDVIKGPTDVASLPKLYVLAIGISRYQSGDVAALQYPAADADAFANAMRRQKGVVYGDVIVKTLTDKAATRAAIEDGLEWLQETPTNKDVAMVFLNGHSVSDSLGRFVYVPYDFDSNHLLSTGISTHDITDALSSIPGKAILFLDTPSPNDTVGIVNTLASSDGGTVVFTPTTGTEMADSAGAGKTDAFTTALVECMRGGANVAAGTAVTVDSLYQYLSTRVPDLTGGKQHPDMERPSTVLDFQVASAAQ